MPDFVPLTRWAGGHRMTLYAWAKRRLFPDLPAPDERYFDVAPDARVLAHCHWQPERRTRPTVIALHGLEGSSEAHYMRGLAAKAWARGCNVVRLNQRNCGGTEHLSQGLYHSGLTADPLYVLRELIATERLPRVAFAGYSLGGNLALKLAGELGGGAPRELTAVAAVSPVMELEACVRAIERRENRIYEWNFCRNLQARMRRKAKAWPGRYDTTGLWKIWSIREFDERYTAPHHGFDGASDYYHRASAMRVVDRIAIPALIVTAEDDPFVPPQPFRDPRVTGNPHITTVITAHGGHCGFVGEANGYDGYWAEKKVVDFLVSRF
jgi:predicted alpha/beta-fold hydrolase